MSSSSLALYDRGIVEHSQISFTSRGPVTTITYMSSQQHIRQALQVAKEIVVLRGDEIEIYAPSSTRAQPLSSLPTFSLIRDHIMEVYNVDILKVPEEEVRVISERLGPLIAFYVMNRNTPSINPKRIYDRTRRVDYDNL